LGRSLVRLHRNLERNRNEEARVESLYVSWQEKWSNRRDQIARRLALIETQLDQLAEQTERPPRLAVVGAPLDAEQISSTAQL
jgi:septation ring formation regulator EzrA